MAEINIPKARPQKPINGPRPGVVAHPLGPLVYRIASKRAGRARLIGGLVLCGSAAFLSVAAWITPDPTGFGSHHQLGYPPCTVLVVLGYPCPTCGMTTAFAHTVRGELLSAFKAQPAGLALALATIVAASVSLGTVITGKVWVVNWYRVPPVRVTLVAVMLLAGAWAYKIVAGVLSGTLPVGH